MNGFEQLLALDEVSQANYRVHIPDGWQQGRGAFGGLVGSLMMRAARKHLPATPMRSMQAQFLAPAVVGHAECLVSALKAGTGVAAASVVMMQQDVVVANATIVAAGARKNPMSWATATPPTMRPWSELSAMPLGLAMAPVFTQHFEYRPTGPMPFSGGKEARSDGWIQVRQAGGAVSDELVLAYADAYWASAMVRLPMPRPAATVSFALQYQTPLVGRSDEPLYLRASAPWAADGYCTEFRELWTASGELVATNQQVIAII